jgi:uncharacterized protein YbaR (Trm112 family)
MFYHYYWSIPLIILGIFIIFLAICLMIKHRRRQHSIPVHHHTGVNIVQVADVESVPPRNPENIHRNLNKCMQCENTLTYWRLNCGGTLCNNCVVKFSSALASNHILHCPQCNNPVFNLNYMNRYRPDNDLEISRIENCIPLNSEENRENICSICRERPCDKKINCQSTDHYLCYVCYDRLVNVQKILLCPYCKTLIRNAIHDEEAPVVLGS